MKISCLTFFCPSKKSKRDHIPPEFLKSRDNSDTGEVLASSTPTECGGFFPEFFPPMFNPPSPILPAQCQLVTNLQQNTLKINMRYMDTQLQYGSCDCGIFAIAFALTLAS